MDHRDLGGEQVLGPFAGAAGLLTGAPGVEGGAGDAQDAADPLDAPGAVVVLNETEADQEPSTNYCLFRPCSGL
nr:hypothetical protein [Streptomyces sp. TLI_235]